MAYTDNKITAYIFPQDGASEGIDNTEADWNNAAYLGGLAKAKTENYAPQGLNISPDHINNNFDLSEGLAFLEDTENIDFRNWDDSEINRSGTWTQGYLLTVHTKSAANIPFQTTTGTNYIYLGFDRTANNYANGQNNIFVRVADTEADAPVQGFKIGEIDATTDDSVEQNRVAGYSWNYLGKKGTGGSYVSEADISIPDNSFDEYKVKFVAVDGDATSTGTTLTGTVNNHTANYWYRTTQNNTQGNSLYKLMQGRPSHMPINGHMYYSQKGGKWTFSNRITTNQEKQYAFAGGNVDGAATTPINSLQYSWNSGNIKGEWNIWARDVL